MDTCLAIQHVLRNIPTLMTVIFNMAMEISKFTQNLYPRAQIWYSGHSLGGALASLVAIATQRPAVTFEAPGEFIYAQRIGLIPSFQTLEERRLYLESLPIFHFGNDLDPIFLGRCNGPLSSCYFAGYAMETQCHSGKSCVYSSERKSMEEFRQRFDAHPDIESKLVNINYHRLTYLLNQYLIPKVSVPACQVEMKCQDCPVWKFHI
jgi:putative lipase involved disintegration of autophagic bodies